MSIKYLARDLYKALQKVDALKKELDKAPLAEQGVLFDELRIAEKELELIRRMFDGEKENASIRSRFSSFKVK